MKLSINEREVVKLRANYIPVPQFDSLEIAAQPMSTIKREGKGSKTVPASQQLESLKKFLGLFKGSYTYCISSPVHDGYAKFIGAVWFLRWLEAQQLSNRSRPIWHSINGGYYDLLRDKKPACSGLIVTGVVAGSSQVKIEKLRDILELYPAIPKVILTSDKSPIETFDPLKILLTSGIWLSMQAKRKVEQL